MGSCSRRSPPAAVGFRLRPRRASPPSTSVVRSGCRRRADATGTGRGYLRSGLSGGRRPWAARQVPAATRSQRRSCRTAARPRRGVGGEQHQHASRCRFIDRRATWLLGAPAAGQQPARPMADRDGRHPRSPAARPAGSGWRQARLAPSPHDERDRHRQQEQPRRRPPSGRPAGGGRAGAGRAPPARRRPAGRNEAVAGSRYCACLPLKAENAQQQPARPTPARAREQRRRRAGEPGRSPSTPTARTATEQAAAAAFAR